MASISSWRFVKKLSFDNAFWGHVYPELITEELLEKVFSRCRRFLTHVDLNNIPKHINVYAVIEMIIKHCPNIEHFEASRVKLNTTLVKNIGRKHHNLVSLSIGKTTNFIDEALYVLFENNQSLKRFCVTNNKYVEGECFKKLNHESIEEIMLENCPSTALLENLNVSILKLILVLQNYCKR